MDSGEHHAGMTMVRLGLDRASSVSAWLNFAGNQIWNWNNRHHGEGRRVVPISLKPGPGRLRRRPGKQDALLDRATVGGKARGVGTQGAQGGSLMKSSRVQDWAATIHLQEGPTGSRQARAERVPWRRGFVVRLGWIGRGIYRREAFSRMRARATRPGRMWLPGDTTMLSSRTFCFCTES